MPTSAHGNPKSAPEFPTSGLQDRVATPGPDVVNGDTITAASIGTSGPHALQVLKFSTGHSSGILCIGEKSPVHGAIHNIS